MLWLGMLNLCCGTCVWNLQSEEHVLQWFLQCQLWLVRCPWCMQKLWATMCLSKKLIYGHQLEHQFDFRKVFQLPEVWEKNVPDILSVAGAAGKRKAVYQHRLEKVKEKFWSGKRSKFEVFEDKLVQDIWGSHLCALKIMGFKLNNWAFLAAIFSAAF